MSIFLAIPFAMPLFVAILIVAEFISERGEK